MVFTSVLFVVPQIQTQAALARVTALLFYFYQTQKFHTLLIPRVCMNSLLNLPANTHTVKNG